GSPALEGQRATIRASPAAVTVFLEEQVVADDARELAVLDDDDAPGHDDAVHDPARKAFLEPIAFAVAVEDPGDGGHPPVDDANLLRGIEKRHVAEKIVHRPLALVDAQVRDVGRRRIGETRTRAPLRQTMADAHLV